MKKYGIYLLSLFIAVLNSCTEEEVEKYIVQTITEDGYSYQIVSNDDLEMREYTLDNGLKVFMTVNKDEPRIQTAIAVKAGSSYDPAETTGLAHYLEHMVFKGTDKIGTIDWEKEEALLKEIEELYEQHLMTSDTAEKRAIYHQIDSVSTEASKYAIANEYDKMVSQIGAKYTNAYTSTEQTVYINNIAENEFEKWVKLERERFGKLVLRLFHTELESVYEEFNRGLDNDNYKIYHALMRNMFPNHPYGTQTTIGTSEHLKNPSMKKIHEYFNAYYIPNNMAICLSGDLDPSATIKIIDQYFGDMQKSEVPAHRAIEAGPINGAVIEELLGPDKESVRLAYRFDGVNSYDEKMVLLIDLLLNNANAGIIDLDLVQQQKILGGGCFPRFMKDYGMHTFHANPREGQTLEEAKDLLLEAIGKVKKGDFGDWLIPAVINDMQLESIKQNESNWVAFQFVNAFVLSVPWIDKVRMIDDISEFTKEQIVKFANEHYQDNYVILYKRNGKDTTIAKVDKPPITPLELNRVDESVFMKEFKAMDPPRLQPVFINYDESIARTSLKSGVELSYIENTTNELFSLFYIIDMGKNHSKKLALAVQYLPFLGTTKYTPAQLQEEFYKLGLSMDVFTSSRRSYVYISGLGKSMEQGVQLLEHVLDQVKEDQQAYDDYVDGILKKRSDNKLSKSKILWSGLRNYAKYGSKSGFTDIIPSDELGTISPSELTDQIKGICDYKHDIFYYGQSGIEEVVEILDKYHIVNSELKDYPEEAVYPELDITDSKVYFAHYDMVQAEIMMTAKDEIFNKEYIPYSKVFSEYFGGGLSSIVFQEIREAKGLAYSAFSSYSTPGIPNQSHYVTAYVGTQADKLKDAVPAMMEIMHKMPRADKQFEVAKDAILKNIESERITKKSIYWSYRGNKDRGIDYDVRKDIYKKVQSMTLDEMETFFNDHVVKDNYTYTLLMNRDALNKEMIEKYGALQEVTLEELFGY